MNQFADVDVRLRDDIARELEPLISRFPQISRRSVRRVVLGRLHNDYQGDLRGAGLDDQEVKKHILEKASSYLQGMGFEYGNGYWQRSSYPQ